jgi:hypothetical protein
MGITSENKIVGIPRKVKLEGAIKTDSICIFLLTS